jgi:hypothetical protein
MLVRKRKDKECLLMNSVSGWPLFLACARPELTADASTRLSRKIHNSQVDWDRFVKRALRHGIAPLIYYNLTRLNLLSRLPVSVAQQLRLTYYYNAARNEAFYRAIGRIQTIFNAAGIPVVLLKGAALAEIVYSDKAIRPMSDVDLLVRPEDLLSSGRELGRIGYIRLVERGSRQADEHYEYHAAYINKEPGVAAPRLEIHWNIDRASRPFQIDNDGLWRRAKPIEIGGVECAMLSPEDCLLHVCLHACKHGLTSLRSLCDIVAIVDHWNECMDWRSLQARCRDWKVQNYTYVPLRLARDLFDAEIPESVLNNLRPAEFDTRVIASAKRELLEAGTSGTTPTNRLDSWRVLDLWRARGLRHKLAIVSAALSSGIILDRYPVGSSGKARMYLPIRIIDLIRRHGRLHWRLLLRDKRETVTARRRARLLAFLAPFEEHWNARAQ